MALIPAILKDHAIYKAGASLPYGTGDVELPALEAMTATHSGSGIPGELEVPVTGHFGSMELTINWLTVDDGQFDLMEGQNVSLEIRGVQQLFETETASEKLNGVKVVVRGLLKSTELGTFTKGSPTDGTSVIEVTYLKVFVGGKAKLEIDKLNYIYRVNGKDRLADDRAFLGRQ